jgi:hypothetical protein
MIVGARFDEGAAMRPPLRWIVLLAGCSPHAAAPHAAATQPQCDYVNYNHDESVNAQGPARCTTDCDCDGLRACKDGACTGEARPVGMDHCNDPSYRWNEAWNGGGSGLCGNDCECDGARVCTAGHCTDDPTHRSGDSSLTR